MNQFSSIQFFISFQSNTVYTDFHIIYIINKLYLTNFVLCHTINDQRWALSVLGMVFRYFCFTENYIFSRAKGNLDLRASVSSPHKDRHTGDDN